MTAIRLVGASHAAALAEVHAGGFGPAERWSASAIAGLLATPGTFALVAAGGAAMAMFRVAADEAELLTVAVRAEARRQGLARLLLAEGAGRVAAAGARTLFLEVSRANAPALALYRSLGFARTGMRRRYYADGSDALLMSRPLDPPCGSAAS